MYNLGAIDGDIKEEVEIGDNVTDGLGQIVSFVVILEKSFVADILVFYIIIILTTKIHDR